MTNFRSYMYSSVRSQFRKGFEKPPRLYAAACCLCTLPTHLSLTSLALNLLQELAVENSGGLNGGLGAWHGDMMPFSDEQNIKGGICVGGDAWHRGLLLDIVQTGLLYNAYNTPVETLHGLDEVDCFIGGLGESLAHCRRR